MSREEVQNDIQIPWKDERKRDLVEVVRCKDCRNNHWCNIQEAAMAGDNFFCGAAERRIDE